MYRVELVELYFDNILKPAIIYFRGGEEGREGVVGGRRILRGNMVFHGKRSGISRCQRSRRALLKINCQLTANEGGQKNITEPWGVFGKFNRDTTKNL